MFINVDSVACCDVLNSHKSAFLIKNKTKARSSLKASNRVIVGSRLAASGNLVKASG